MDKYEFNIKVEQIKKLVNKGDYETAMKIADTIDWRRVRSANLLALVAEIYENNEEYQEAKEVLLLAFERAPIGKRLLYKLADLALKENNLKEAEDYYREFCDLAPEDPRQHLLRYQILKAKKASDEQLIHSLERYTNTELDEKWLYELAELYCRAGKEEECIQTCDKIMLMFGLGKFVDKAMQLKVQYAPLSSYQMDLIENRDKYEEKLRAVEQEFGDETREIMGEEYENAVRAAAQSQPAEGQPDAVNPAQSGGAQQYAKPLTGTEANQQTAAPYGETPAMAYSKPQPVAGMDAGRESRQTPKPQPVVIVDEPTMAAEPTAEVDIGLESGSKPYHNMEEEMKARIHQAETEERLAREMSKIPIQEYNEPEAPMGQTKVIGSIREILTAYSSSGALPGREVVEQLMPEVRASMRGNQAHLAMSEKKPVGREEVMRRAAEVNYLMIETRTPEKGLELAVEVLKRLHKEKGTKCPVVKITGSKLSRKGVMESTDKLVDKDLIIEEAGDLTVVALIELQDLIETSEIRVIMIDNPRQIESMTRVNPALGSLFTVITLTEDGELEVRRPEPIEEPKVESVRFVEETVEEVPVKINYEPPVQMAVEERPVVEPAAVEPPVVEVPVAEPVIVEPAVVESAVIEPAVIEPSAEAVVEPEVVPEAAVEMASEVTNDTVPEAVQEEVQEEVPEEIQQEMPEEAPEAVSEDTTVSVEEPAAVPEENTAAAVAEFMKLMESVIDDEPAVVKPDGDPAQGDNTAAVMAEFMRLMESVMEDPSAAAADTGTAGVEAPFAGVTQEIPVTPIIPTMQPENPMAAAMAAATAVPVGMAGGPVTPMGTPMSTVTSVPLGMPVTPVMVQSTPQPIHDVSSLRSDEEMELHDFVEYTCKYASDIDCSITGKSMLALYERIEVMEENGVPLTKINAENLIEEAADKAEKFSFKKLFTGLFHPRYDKEGLLILREEHFMN